MNWKRGSAYHLLSDTAHGRYHISKTLDKARVVYTAWAPRQQPGVPNPISNHPAAINDTAAAASALDAAKRDCRHHLAQQEA